jgi:hypothetical protein
MEAVQPNRKRSVCGATGPRTALNDVLARQPKGYAASAANKLHDGPRGGTGRRTCRPDDVGNNAAPSIHLLPNATLDPSGAQRDKSFLSSNVHYALTPGKSDWRTIEAATSRSSSGEKPYYVERK